MQQPFRIKTKLFTLLLLLSQTTVLFSQSAYGQETRRLEREKKTTDTVEKRVALVIGNGDYLRTKSLPNPVNDANDVAEKLTSLGFEVIKGTNLNKRNMDLLIRDFGTRLIQTGGVGMFFYAGHGLQYRGDNYLIPIDADITAEDEIAYQAVNVGQILAKLETAQNNLNIIMLDACRDNPFAAKWSSFRNTGNDGGLAKMNAPTGTMLIYATEPGNVASDGSGRNGLFTESLLNNIDSPNIELEQLIKKIARDVKEKSNNKQTPWKEGLILGDFFFNKVETKKLEQALVDKPQPVKVNPSNSVSNARQLEENAWNLVKDSITEDDFTFFLDEFPEGVYSAQAKKMLEQLAWDAIRTSTDKNKIQVYLAKYPDGLNSASARIKLRQIESLAKATVPVLPSAKSEPEKAENDSTKTREVSVEEKNPENPVETKNAEKTPPITKKPKTALKKPTGKLPKVTSQTDDLGIEFVLIPAGSFIMGLSAANLDETYRMARKDYADFEKAWIQNEMPAHRVEISEDFWMGKTEVTQAQWVKVMGNNPSFNSKCEDCPVERVSWEDAKEFIRKLNEMNNDFVYSLPSEAEWEYAARGGTTRLFAGNIEDLAWHSGNSEGTTNSVESRLPNSFGLYDMHGNVAEWCEDLYELYDPASVTDEVAPSVVKNLRVVRGGSWNVFPTLQRATFRKAESPTLRNIVTGFRLAARLKN